MTLGCGLTSVRGDRGENYEKWAPLFPKKILRKKRFGHVNLLSSVVLNVHMSGWEGGKRGAMGAEQGDWKRGSWLWAWGQQVQKFAASNKEPPCQRLSFLHLFINTTSCMCLPYCTFKNEDNKKPLFLMPAIILLLDQHTYVQKYIVHWYSTWLSDFYLFFFENLSHSCVFGRDWNPKTEILNRLFLVSASEMRISDFCI